MNSSLTRNLEAPGTEDEDNDDFFPLQPQIVFLPEASPRISISFIRLYSLREIKSIENHLGR